MSALQCPELDALRERNEQRLQEAKQRLGTKYLLHPANQVRRKSANEPAFIVGRGATFADEQDAARLFPGGETAPDWLVERLK